VLVAAITRIAAATAIGGEFHFADEAIYADAARALSHGQGFAAEYRKAPAYPVFLALLAFGLPVNLLVLRIGQAAVAALGVLAVAGLARRMFGSGAGIAAGLVYALDPLMVIASGLLYPEAIAAVLMPVAVLLALEGVERDSLGRSAAAGGLLGLLALLRPVALVVAPVVAVWMVLAAPKRGRRLQHAGALCLACALVLAPWAVRNLAVRGQALPAMAGTHTAPLDRQEVAREGVLRPLARWIAAEPAGALARSGRQFLQFWEFAPTRLATDDPVRRELLHQRDRRLAVQPLFSRGLRDTASMIATGLELALAVVGLAAVGRDRWRRALLPVLVTLSFAAGYSLFVAKLRYRIPVMPLVFVFTGAGIAAVYRKSPQR